MGIRIIILLCSVSFFLFLSWVLIPDFKTIISRYLKYDFNSDRSNDLSGILLFVLFSIFVIPILYFVTYKSLYGLFAYITSDSIQGFFELSRGVWAYKKVLSTPSSVFITPLIQVVAYCISFYSIRNFSFYVNRKAASIVFTERDVFVCTWFMTFSASILDILFLAQSFTLVGSTFHNMFIVFSKIPLLITWVLCIHTSNLSNNNYIEYIIRHTTLSKIDKLVIYSPIKIFVLIYLVSFIFNLPFIFGLQFSGALVLSCIGVAFVLASIFRLKTYTRAFSVISFGEGENMSVMKTNLFLKKINIKLFDGNKIKLALFSILLLALLYFTIKGLILIFYLSLAYLILIIIVWLFSLAFVKILGVFRAKPYKANLLLLRLFASQFVKSSIAQFLIIGIFFLLITIFPKQLSTENYYKETATTCFVDMDGNYMLINYNDTINCIAVRQTEELPDNFKKFLFLIEDRTFQNQNRIIPSDINPTKITNWHGISFTSFAGMLIGRGGSNLNMQLIKNHVFWQKEVPKDIQRKLIEQFSAYQLSRRYSKNDLLKYYCDIASFNAGIGGMQGINSISLFTFGRPPNQLNNLELFYLAQTAKGKSIEISNSKRVACKDAPQHKPEIKNRLLQIAKVWLNNGLIEPELYDDLCKCDLTFTYKRYKPTTSASTQNFLRKFQGNESGSIYTSSTSQKNQQKMQNAYAKFQKDFSKYLKKGNSTLCASALVVDVKTGKILGHLSEGTDEDLTLFGNGFEIASLIKLFILLEHAKYEKHTNIKLTNGRKMLSNEDVIIQSDTKAIYNLDKVSNQIEIYKNVESRFNEMGINQDKYLDFKDENFKFKYSYGHRNMTLYDIAQAYQTLFNNGVCIKLSPVTEIYSPITNKSNKNQASKNQIYNPALTNYFTKCMEGVVNDKRGTAYGIKDLIKKPQNIMAKTGTTNNDEHGYIVISDGDILIIAHLTYGKVTNGMLKTGTHPIPHKSGGKSAGVLGAYIYNEFCDC